MVKSTQRRAGLLRTVATYAVMAPGLPLVAVSNAALAISAAAGVAAACFASVAGRIYDGGRPQDDDGSRR